VIDEEQVGPEEGELDEHYEFTEDDIIIEHSLEDGEEEEEGGMVKEEEEVTEVTEVVQGIGEHVVSNSIPIKLFFSRKFAHGLRFNFMTYLSGTIRDALDS
jgi:hypothetical protein